MKTDPAASTYSMAPVAAVQAALRQDPSAQELRVMLAPLIQRMREFDRLRVKLEHEGGLRSDLDQLSALLGRPIELCTRPQIAVMLKDMKGIQNALRQMMLWNVSIQVRRITMSLPAWLLCQVRADYAQAYDVVLDDIYRSPGYPLGDPRFPKIMRWGHEVFHLRVSHLRARLSETLAATGQKSIAFLEQFLRDIAHHLFAGAWHEDQYLARCTAETIGLPRFQEAVEFVYLCGIAELSELRSFVETFPAHIEQFFEHVEPRPVIQAFLRVLPRLDGKTLGELPSLALPQYLAVEDAFGRFVRTQIRWGHRGLLCPLFKVILANFSRLDLIADDLRQNEAIQAATTALEADSARIATSLLRTVT
ncbi:MAG: hypothetical protein JXR37_28280 [Kiritimatiellae bacterium]|nr:hypothetical protein [Kiritimatiellia bacterium]